MPFHAIEDPDKLKRVLEATLLLEADLDLPVLLAHVIDEARSLTGARYGALGILDSGGTVIVDFLTVGLTSAEEEQIGPRPTGRGVLGLFMDEPRSLRLAHLGTHPDSIGFPAGHPPMESFMGVPIKVRNEVYGSLYLTDKVGAAEFTDEDQSLVEALAVAAGMAIENTRLHQRVQELAVAEDRDRMARDLHDTVVQHLYAVGSRSRPWPRSRGPPAWRTGSARWSPTSAPPSARSGPASTSSGWRTPIAACGRVCSRWCGRSVPWSASTSGCRSTARWTRSCPTW